MFRFGVDYYPEHWPEERWATDAALMQRAGFNTVRLAEFAWSRLEPRPGEFDFAWLDRAIALLHQHGIQVVLGTPTASPPPWVMQMHPDAFRVLEDGRRLTYGNRREYCPSHAGYRERGRIVTQAMAEHYKDNPAVIGWQTDNEFGDRCYCPICRAHFQEWLRQKYGTLDALNAAWGTIFWSHVYTDWVQIPLPLQTANGRDDGSPNPGLGLDFYRCMSDAYVTFQREQIDILRAVCPNHFITHNLMGFKYDKLNYYDLAADLEFVSWDNYPRMQWTFKADVDPSHAALQHDAMRSLLMKNFWVMEQQSGPGGWQIVSVQPRPGELQLWAWQAIARGADAIIFFRWRTALFGTEEYWHGILEHHGEPGRRYAEIEQMGAEVQRAGAAIFGSAVQAPVAMLLSYDSRFAFQIQQNNPQFSYPGHFEDIYAALHRRNVAIDVRPPEADLSGYKLVVAPALYVLPQAVADNLRRFVEAGGVLMVTPRTGVKNEDNACVSLPLPGLLADLCGVRVSEYDSLPVETTQSLAFAPGTLDEEATATTSAWCDVLELNGAEPVAIYTADYYAGKPAITLNKVGNGAVVYVGTFGGRALYDTLADWLLAQADVAARPAADGVELCERLGDGRRLLFVLNHAAEERAVQVDGQWTSLLDGSAVEGTLRLAPRQVAVLSQAR